MALVAVDEADLPIGLAHALFHRSTWSASHYCYLEDLFVDPACRGLGIGRSLIADLVSLGKARGWSRLYWHTRRDNPARALYDRFVEADDFVRYRMEL
jgi:GNAT superfamily N-acetyltransferase